MNQGVDIEPRSTIVPGRIQTAFDTTVTSATSPLTLYTVQGGYTLYLDYIFAYCYAFTPAGAAVGAQLTIDQNVTGYNVAFMRFYALGNNYQMALKKPLIVSTNISFVALGGAGAGGTFSIFLALAGDCV